MKVLYAAANREGSYHQYSRFLQSIKHKDIELQTAGYQRSIKDLTADYTLDALLNFSKTDKSFIHNNNYSYYVKQIELFAPDLIISDLEIFTSKIALELKIQLWQVSSFLLYWALPDNIKKQMKAWSSSSYLLSFGNSNNKKQINNMIMSSNKRYVVSHLCDTIYADNIKDGFEWVRPEFNFYDVGSANNSIARGYETITADLFYNQKTFEFDVDISDPEALVLSEVECLYNKDGKMDIRINDNVKFLKELL